MFVKRTACTPEQTPLAQLLASWRSPEDAAAAASKQYSLSPIELLALVWKLRQVGKSYQAEPEDPISEFQVGSLAAELRHAATVMTPLEAELADALADVAADIHVAVQFLRLLINPNDDDFDSGHAFIAGEVIRLLCAAGHRAVGTHAAAVARAIGSTAH